MGLAVGKEKWNENGEALAGVGWGAGEREGRDWSRGQLVTQDWGASWLGGSLVCCAGG